ncbi:uncharacterized protein Tco025E_02138, partial [Trypanosoma conorhini]
SLHSCKKYGPEPAVAAAVAATPAAAATPATSSPANRSLALAPAGAPSPYRDRLAAFYERYAPAKLRQVDAQLQKYADCEEDFFAALVQKYGPEPAVAATAVSAWMRSCADPRQSTASEAGAGGDISRGAAMGEEDAIAEHIPDEGRQRLLRGLAAELGVAVRSQETLVVLAALLDARGVQEFGAGPLPDAETRACRVLSGSMRAPSAPRRTATTQRTVSPSLSVADLSKLAAAVGAEEARSRASLELLAADDFDILLAAHRRELRRVERDGAISALRASAEAALLRRAWRGWRDTAAERARRARRGQRRQWSRYQKMLFSKSVAAYYARLSQAQRDAERRRMHVDATNAKAEALRRRRLQETVAAHGNIVTRNVLAVLLGRAPAARRPRDPLATPETNPAAAPASGDSKWQEAHSRRLARSPCWLGDAANTHGGSGKKGSRGARLLAIERDFDSLPATARARVVRTLKKWDMLPTSPPRHASRSSTRLHASQEREEQLARRLDTLDAFAAVADGDAPSPCWESETELRQYLTRVLVDALEAEERDLPAAAAA